MTFKPLLSKRSLRLAKKVRERSRSRSVNKSNLTEEEKEKKRNLEFRRKATPKINKRSKYIDQQRNGANNKRFEKLY